MTVHSHTDIAAQPPSESTHVGGLKLWNPRLYERIRNLSILLHRRRSEDGDGGRGGRPPATLTTDYCLARVAASQESAVNKERLIKKVFGHAFYYFNSILNHHHSQTLWADVVQQISKEVKKWPHDFPQSKDFIPSHQRETISGQLLIQDPYIQGGRFINASE